MTKKNKDDFVPIYSIAFWDRIYENSESRKVVHCKYVCTPNKHEGGHYGRMMAHPEGERLFAAWNAIIQVASKMPRRGTLATFPGSFRMNKKNLENVPDFREWEPLSPEDLADRTKLRAETFRLAFDFFSSPEMSWLAVEWRKKREIQMFEDDLDGKHPRIPGLFPDAPELSGLNGRERKGTEGNGSEGQDKTPKGDPMPKKQIQVDLTQIPVELLAEPAFMEVWTAFVEMRNEIKKPATAYAQKLILKQLEALSGADLNLAIRILEQSIRSSWQDVYPLKKEFQAAGAKINGKHFEYSGPDARILESEDPER